MREILTLLKRFDIKALFFEPSNNGLLCFFRYAIVGGIATVVDWGVLCILTELGIFYLFSAVFGFFAGLIANYVLSKLFVFNGSETKVRRSTEFITYGVIGVIGLGATLGIMYLLTNLANIHYFITKMIATILVLLWNYFARKKLLYR